jgi:hypothetical protein
MAFSTVVEFVAQIELASAIRSVAVAQMLPCNALVRSPGILHWARIFMI